MSDAVFQTETAGDVLIVVPAGDHVGFQMARIVDETGRIVERIKSGGIRSVVVDAGEASYLTSMVIGSMIQIWEAVTQAGGRFVVCNLSEDALEAIAATRLDTRWPHYDSRAEALQALSEASAPADDGGC